MNKRILIIENSRSMTGALKAIITSSLCIKDFFDFQFIIPNGNTKEFILKSGFTDVHEWKMIEISRRLGSLLFYVPQLLINAFKLKSYVKRHRIDLIHVNDLYNLVPAVAVMLGCKTPYVCHVRFMPGSHPSFLFNAWLKINLRYAKKVIVVSKALQQSLPHHEKIEVAYDGMIFAESSRSEFTSRNVFLYLSSIIRGKGQDLALDAFIKVHQQLPGWKLRFVGGDNDLKRNSEFLQSLKDIAIKNGVADKIEWAGFIQDVEREYRSADILLNFSESESFSMSTLEALSYNRPIVVSNCGGPAEIVDNGVNGILVPNRDVDAMANAMVSLAKSAELRQKLSVNASTEMQARFDAKITSQKIMKVYRNCIGGI